MNRNSELGGEQFNPTEREKDFNTWNASKDFRDRAEVLKQGLRPDTLDILSKPPIGLSLPTAEALFAERAHSLSEDASREASPLMARVLKIAREMETKKK